MLRENTYYNSVKYIYPQLRKPCSMLDYIQLCTRAIAGNCFITRGNLFVTTIYHCQQLIKSEELVFHGVISFSFSFCFLNKPSKKQLLLFQTWLCTAWERIHGFSLNVLFNLFFSHSSLIVRQSVVLQLDFIGISHRHIFHLSQMVEIRKGKQTFSNNIQHVSVRSGSKMKRCFLNSALVKQSVIKCTFLSYFFKLKFLSLTCESFSCVLRHPVIVGLRDFLNLKLAEYYNLRNKVQHLRAHDYPACYFWLPSEINGSAPSSIQSQLTHLKHSFHLVLLTSLPSAPEFAYIVHLFCFPIKYFHFFKYS